MRPLSPDAVERIRATLLRQGRLRDATLISVLAYAGLRPGEALGLRWSDVRDRTLLVERSVALGDIAPTKTRRIPTVRLLGPLADDLAVLREHSGGEGDALVFPARSGDPWSEQAYRGWRRRVFKPAAAAAGGAISRPYDLRHSFISLLLAEGRAWSTWLPKLATRRP